MTAESVTDDGSNRTGHPASTDPTLVNALLAGGFFPVVSPVSMDSAGMGINVNADEAALALAEGLKAEILLFLSDIPGILEDGKTLKELTPDQAEEKISNGVISGGMIPKVRSSITALHNGTDRIIIGGFENSGDLGRLLSRIQGTVLKLK